MVFDNMNRCDTDAVIAAFDAKDVDFIKKEIDIGYQTFEIATAAVKPFSSHYNPVYECMPVEQDQVRTIILSVNNNTLYPQSFYKASETQTAVSKFKMLVDVKSILEPKEIDNLWLHKEPWNVTIDISSTKKIVEGLNGLDQGISAVPTRAKGVTPEWLSKI